MRKIKIRNFHFKEKHIYIILIILHLLPIFTGKYFPTSDGPAHLYNADLLKGIITENDSLISDFYMINLSFNPNWLSHILLTGFLFIFPDFISEKLILCICLVFLPLSLRYAISKYKTGSMVFSFLVFPFLYNVVFHFGMYNFCLSLIFFFYLLGFWISVDYKFTMSRNLTITLLVTLVYFTHPITYFISALLLGFISIENSIMKKENRSVSIMFLKNFTVLIIAYIPSAILMLLFLSKEYSQTIVVTSDYFNKFKDLFTLEPLRYMGFAEASYLYILLAIFVLIFISCIYYSLINKYFKNIFPFLVTNLLLVLLYIFIPDSIFGGSVIKPRLGLIFYLLLILFFAHYNFSKKKQRIVLYIILPFSLIFLSFRAGQYHTIQTGIDEYMTAKKFIPPNSVILPLYFNKLTKMPNGKEIHSYIDVFLHCSNYLCIGKDVVCLQNYEANTDYFPILWKKNMNPSYEYICSQGDRIFEITQEIRTYENIINRPIDIVLICNLESEENEIYKRLFYQYIKNNFKEIYISPNGLIRVFRRA